MDDYSQQLFYASKVYRQQIQYAAACRAGRKWLWTYYGIDPTIKGS